MSTKVYDLKNSIQWIDVTKPDSGELENISAQYHIPQNIVKDCLDPDHLPKYEKLKDCNFIILRMYAPDAPNHAHSVQELTTKIALFFNSHFLITVHRLKQPFVEKIKEIEAHHDECCIDNLVARIVAYCLNTFQKPAFALDEQVDRYESTILLKNTKPAMLQGLYYIKRKAYIGRKMVVLTTDIISLLQSTQADKSLLQDLQDLYTRLMMIYDEILDDVNNLTNIYLSLTSQKTNEVVKVLTIFSVFFMPLTFIVGIYGMNFHYMPELSQKWGYPAVMGLMALLVVLIFLWFRRRKWL